MGILRELSRQIYTCPEVDSNDYCTYPGVLFDMQQDMESAISDKSKVYFFLYFCVNCDGIKYIQIYVYDYKLYPDIPKRFVIVEGCRLNDDDERMLLEYLNNPINYDSQNYSVFIKSVMEAYPEWHLDPSRVLFISRTLERIYFSGHRSGPKEILYKAGLDVIAACIDEFEYSNLYGTTPVDIVGEGVTLRMLRLLNSSDFVNILYSHERKSRFITTYRLCSDYIGNINITRTQWEYLDDLCSYGVDYLHKRFNRHLFESLHSDDGKRHLNDYVMFNQLCKEYGLSERIKTPEPEDIKRVVNQIGAMHMRAVFHPDDDEKLRIRREMNNMEYSYGEYSVIMPVSVKDFLVEAVEQHNCLFDYLGSHVCDVSTILFLRKKDNIEKPFVDIEIYKGTINQVYASCNSLPEIEVYRFLEIYSLVFGLEYDPYSIIVEYNGMRRAPHFKELYKYAKKHKIHRQVINEHAKNSMHVMYKQISFEEAFPELFETDYSDDFFADDQFVF